MCIGLLKNMTTASGRILTNGGVSVFHLTSSSHFFGLLVKREDPEPM